MGGGSISPGMVTYKVQTVDGLVLVTSKRKVKVEYPDGWYEGSLLNGERDGEGEMKYNNLKTYLGDWKRGKYHGKGSLFGPDNMMIYSGNWEVGKFHGYGHRDYPNKDIYNGYFVNGKKHGEGHYLWWKPNGYRDEGFWVKNYEGGWINDAMHGTGELYEYDKDGKERIIYNGEWGQGHCHGKGTRYYRNGDVYQGSWKNGNREGNGTYSYKNGPVYTGEWLEDEQHGQGTMTLGNHKYSSSWTKGRENKKRSGVDLPVTRQEKKSHQV